ncbi:hypothetical protein NQ317_009502, partial [Molorchus minor]
GGSWNGYEFHTYPHPSKKSVIPRDVMVDVINDLGLKLLAIHNEYNENNIAISPYGSLSVIVALGEGLQGEAVHEIQQAAHLPNDISIIRVGLRDVHRHLKSYFIPKEGFLAGLSLNHENVTLRPEYEEILKFYGYDTISFNNVLFPQPETTVKPETTLKSGIGTTTQPALLFTTEISEIDTTTAEPVTTTSIISTTSGITESVISTEAATTEVNKSMTTIATDRITTEESATQAVSTSNPLPQTTETEYATMEPKTLEVTTPEAVTKATEVSTNAEMITTTQNPEVIEAVTAEAETSLPTVTAPLQTTMQQAVPKQVTTSIPTTTMQETIGETAATNTEGSSSSNRAEDSTTDFTTIQNILTTSSADTSTATQTIASTLSSFTNAITLPVTTELFNNESNTDQDISTLPTTETTDLSTVDDTTIVVPTDNTVTDSLSTETTITTDSTTTDNNVNEIDSTDSFIEETGFGGVKRKAPAEYRRKELGNIVELNMKEGMGMLSLNSNRRSRSVVDYVIARYYDDQFNYHRPHRPFVPDGQLSFLVYGKYREYHINFMKYDTVLPFLYVAHLNAMALSFPLDSTKYYLLLLLPADETGIDKLVCDLRLNGSLKYIIGNLKQTHVVATIPSFTLKGYVTLTPSFQKLGIRRIFEPRQADFGPMTSQRQIYVTNIEQAITVTIRNYVDPETVHNYRNFHQYDPVHFKADHPFLYFVIDTEIHATLMAGKIVNPLNSRIS